MLIFTPDEIEAIEVVFKDAFYENLERGGKYGSKNYTGALANSFQLRWDNDLQEFKITFNEYGMQFNSPRPRPWPNVDAIRKWVVDRGLISASAKQYEINSVAFLVGRKISEKGVDFFDLLAPIFEQMAEMADFVASKQLEVMQVNILDRVKNAFTIAN